MSVLLLIVYVYLGKLLLTWLPWYAGLLEKRKNIAEALSPPEPKKGILIVDDEPKNPHLSVAHNDISLEILQV